MSALKQALDDLSEKILIADTIGESLDAVAGENFNAPSWVWMYRRQIEAIRDAAEAVQLAIHSQEVTT